MAGNTPNLSLDSFDPTKFYDHVVLQQGVPILDSDWNEASSIDMFRSIVLTRTFVGNGRFPIYPGYEGTPPYNVIEYIGSNTNDFTITGGWAVVEGAIVPTIASSVPTNIHYDDYTENFMFKGTLDAVSAGNMVDLNKNWQSYHNLVGCRVYATGGPGVGTTRVVSSLVSQTSLALVGGTGTFGIGTEYVIYPPALTTPSGDRNDEVYVMVWWDDINENEDSSIVNPGVGIETSHRLERRWCIRVAENGSTPSTPNWFSFGVRYLNLATIARLDGDSTITDAMIQDSEIGSMDYATFSENVIGVPIDKSVNIASPSDRFQATGKWYCGTNIYKNNFKLLNGNRDGLFRSSTTGGPIVVGEIYDSTDSHVADTDDLDNDGFIEDPWIHLDFSKTPEGLTSVSGSFYIRGLRKSKPADVSHSFGVIYGSAVSERKFQDHAEYVKISDLGNSGSPDYDRFYLNITPDSTSDSVQTALTTLFSAVNELYIDTRSGTTFWKLDWRNNSVKTNSAVTNTTHSHYHRNGGFAMLTGGYFDGSNNIISGTGTCDVSAIVMDYEDLYIVGKTNVSAGTNLGTFDSASWDYKIKLDGSISQFIFDGIDPVIKSDNKLVLYTSDNYIEAAGPSVNDLSLIVKGNTSYYPTIAISDDGLWLLHNCTYDNGTNLFSQVSASYPSTGLKISNDGFALSIRDAGSSSWTENSWNHETFMTKEGEIKQGNNTITLASGNSSIISFDTIRGGLCMLVSTTTGQTSVFRFNSSATSLVDADSVFSDTKDNANTINFYYELGDYYVQNSTAVSQNIRWSAFTIG